MSFFAESNYSHIIQMFEIFIRARRQSGQKSKMNYIILITTVVFFLWCIWECCYSNTLQYGVNYKV